MTAFGREDTTMGAVASLTIEVPADIAEKLGRLAEGTRRDRSMIAGEALAAYVEHELDALDGIRKGLDDVAARRVVPHDEAMAEIEAVIEAAHPGVARDATGRVVARGSRRL